MRLEREIDERISEMRSYTYQLRDMHMATDKIRDKVKNGTVNNPRRESILKRLNKIDRIVRDLNTDTKETIGKLESSKYNICLDDE